MKSPDEVLRDMRQSEDDAEAETEEELPPITTIELDCTDDRGRQYKGSFVFKVPTLGDQIVIGKLKAQYLPDGAAADTNAALLVEQICYLEVCLQFSNKHPRPDWWKPFHFYDATPVTALYMEVMAYEARFHGGDKDSDADQGDAGTGQEDGVGTAATDQPHVGRKVQPPAKRREVVSPDTARSG